MDSISLDRSSACWWKLVCCSGGKQHARAKVIYAREHNALEDVLHSLVFNSRWAMDKDKWKTHAARLEGGVRVYLTMNSLQWEKGGPQRTTCWGLAGEILELHLLLQLVCKFKPMRGWIYRKKLPSPTTWLNEQPRKMPSVSLVTWTARRGRKWPL